MNHYSGAVPPSHRSYWRKKPPSEGVVTALYRDVIGEMHIAAGIEAEAESAPCGVLRNPMRGTPRSSGASFLIPSFLPHSALGSRAVTMVTSPFSHM